MALKPKQHALIEAIITYPSANYNELAEIVGISKNTITAWKRLPQFQEALDKKIKELWKSSETLAVQNMRKLASEGHFQANKYILDSLGYAPAQKIEADINTDICITVEE